MNKQVIIAGALGAAAAWTCDQPFVTRADDLVAELTQAQTDAAGAVTAAETARDAVGTGAVALAADTAAQKLVTDHAAATKAYDDALTDAKAEAKKQLEAEGAALAARGADDTAGFRKQIVDFTGTVAATAADVLTEEGKITAQDTVYQALLTEVNTYATEKKVLDAALASANAARNAAMILKTAAVEAVDYAKASQTDAWQGNSVAGAEPTTCQARRVLKVKTELITKYAAEPNVGVASSGGWKDQWWNTDGVAECASPPLSLDALKIAEVALLGDADSGFVKAVADAAGAWTTANDEQAAAFKAYDLAMRLKALYLAGCADGSTPATPTVIGGCAKWSDANTAVTYPPADVVNSASATRATAVKAGAYDLTPLHVAEDGKLAGFLTAYQTKSFALMAAVETSAKADIDNAKSTQLIAFYDAELAEIATATVGTAAGSLIVAQTAATTEHTRLELIAKQALQAQKTAIDQEAAAGLRRDRAKTYLDALRTGLAPYVAKVSVQQYLLDEATRNRDAQQALETAANGLKVAADLAVDFAGETVRDADDNRKFLETRAANAAAAWAVYTEAVAAANTAKGLVDGRLAMATSAAAAALEACQGEGYAKAQAARKIADDAASARAALVTDTKTAYDGKVDTGLLCAFPAVDADGVQAPRAGANADGVACGGDAAMCCGAAQKFLKDGTKLSIETCQTRETTHTYQYWPALPADAIVEPKPETWRWQCISGAQKLVAAATATLAASYMMA